MRDASVTLESAAPLFRRKVEAYYFGPNKKTEFVADKVFIANIVITMQPILITSAVYQGVEIHVYGTHSAPLFVAAEIADAARIENYETIVAGFSAERKSTWLMKVGEETKSITMLTVAGIYNLPYPKAYIGGVFNKWINELIIQLDTDDVTGRVNPVIVQTPMQMQAQIESMAKEIARLSAAVEGLMK